MKAKTFYTYHNPYIDDDVYGEDEDDDEQEDEVYYENHITNKRENVVNLEELYKEFYTDDDDEGDDDEQEDEVYFEK